jgi:phospholipid-translocating ATPase
LCCSSEEEDVCFIETKNLDGETNLKSRHGVPELSHLRTAAMCGQARFRVDAEPADVNMYKLNGAVILPGEEGQAPDGKPLVHPIDLQTTILRGCVLRNTAWVIGVVLFTGKDSKIIMNSGGTPSKRSRVERQMNPQVLLNLVLLAVVAVVCAIVDYFNEKRWDRQQAYWELYADSGGDNPSINALITFANAFITFQNIVPISLYISIEFVRTAQAAFIYWDHAIKYVKNGVTTRTTARSWNLSDDLGQIDYVFSDKTGTLTQNSMVFRQCSIGGKVSLVITTVLRSTLRLNPS